MSFRSLAAFAVAAGLIAACGALVTAGNDSESAKKPTVAKRKTKKHTLPAFTPQRESAALQFVERHHPELKPVLQRLKTVNADEYRQAIREISDTVEKLANIRKYDGKLHGLMLQAWQVKSRAELLAAKRAFAKGKDDGSAEEIKRLLYQRVDLERRMVEHRRDRLLLMLKNTEDNLRRMKENRDRMVETRFNILTRGNRKPKSARPKPRDK